MMTNAQDQLLSYIHVMIFTGIRTLSPCHYSALEDLAFLGYG